MDAERRLKGVLTLDAAKKAAGGAKAAASSCMVEALSVPETSALGDVLSRTLASDFPVAVVAGESGTLQGEISRETALKALAGRLRRD